MVLAIQMVALAGVIADPLRLAKRLADEATSSSDPAWVHMCFGDLVRFIKLLVEQERLQATADALGYLATVWQAQAQLLKEREDLALGALRKAHDRWPRNRTIRESIEGCAPSGLVLR
jgi:hypothetical protein